MQHFTFDGINKEAYRLVIQYCPPDIKIDQELRLTKLVATALLVGVEQYWLEQRLVTKDENVIADRVKSSIH